VEPFRFVFGTHFGNRWHSALK